MSVAKKTVLAATLLLAVVVLVFLYYNIDPARVGWMPRCPFRWLTGLQCPACGNQRALHALLHGRFGNAFASNPFLVLSSPYLLALLVATVLRRSRPRFYALIAHPHAVYTYLVLICLWWIVRNLL